MIGRFISIPQVHLIHYNNNMYTDSVSKPMPPSMPETRSGLHNVVVRSVPTDWNDINCFASIPFLVSGLLTCNWSQQQTTWTLWYKDTKILSFFRYIALHNRYRPHSNLGSQCIFVFTTFACRLRRRLLMIGALWGCVCANHVLVYMLQFAFNF